MKLLVAISSRYYRTPDGRIWSKTAYDRDMWCEVQEAFAEVMILTRVLPAGAIPQGARPADGPGITYVALPEWRSWKAPLQLNRLYKKAAAAVSECQAAVIHSPSLEAELAFYCARKYGKPLSVECRGEQSLSPQYWKSRGVLLADLLAKYHIGQLKRHLSAAWGCVFVAKQLHAKYASYMKKGARSEVISDIRLPGICFSSPRRAQDCTKLPVKMINVGRLEAQKDQATLIKACAALNGMGLSHWELHLVGEGPLQNRLERLARSLQVSEKVIFHGFVPWGKALFCLLDEMDIFVLSSISEGMPRALIEAMARGLPCISTDVSGAGELLGRESLIPCGRPDLLAARVAETIASPQVLNRLSRQCWSRAQDFRPEGLRNRKIQFLRDFAKTARQKT